MEPNNDFDMYIGSHNPKNFEQSQILTSLNSLTRYKINWFSIFLLLGASLVSVLNTRLPTYDSNSHNAPKLMVKTCYHSDFQKDETFQNASRYIRAENYTNRNIPESEWKSRA